MSTPAVSEMWGLIDDRDITATVAYTALATLFSVSRCIDRLEVTVSVDGASDTGEVSLMAQKVSDNQWVSLGNATVGGAGSETGRITAEIPPGLYDNLAYQVDSVSGTLHVTAYARANAAL